MEYTGRCENDLFGTAHRYNEAASDANSKPCWVHLKSGDAVPVALPLNAPDVWWASALSASGLPVAPGAAAATLRVFGRALAWEETGHTCIDARHRRPGGSRLGLKHAGTGAASVLTATTSTCFEATFDLTKHPAGRYNATLSTPRGDSSPWPLELVALTPPS
jgi:hypothetical protein